MKNEKDLYDRLIGCDNKKRCQYCKKIKTTSDFSKRSENEHPGTADKQWYHSYCRSCENKLTSQRRRKKRCKRCGFKYPETNKYYNYKNKKAGTFRNICRCLSIPSDITDKG